MCDTHGVHPDGHPERHVERTARFRVYVGWDHAVPPFVHEGVLAHLTSHPAVTTVESFGPQVMTTSVDYPDVAHEVCTKILAEAAATVPPLAAGESKVGILICGTGIGMSLAANAVPGIRAALCHDYYTAHMCREHNNANIMCMGARTTGLAVMNEMLDAYLYHNFAGEGTSHERRVGKIIAMKGGSYSAPTTSFANDSAASAATAAAATKAGGGAAAGKK